MWYNSFENITKLVILLASLIMLFMGNVEIGMALLATSGVQAAAKMVDKKKNGKGSGNGSAAVLLLILIGFVVFAGASCQMMKQLPAEVVALNLDVYEIHDSYVTADATLTPEQQMDLLRVTAILRQIMQMMQTGITSMDLMLLEGTHAEVPE